MPKHIFISYVREDQMYAELLTAKLESNGYHVFLDTSDFPGGFNWQQAIERAIKTALALTTLVSSQSVRSEWVMRECTLAQHYNIPVIPITIDLDITSYPPYLAQLQVIDGTHDFTAAFAELLTSLPTPSVSTTLGEARDNYLQRATLKSRHTIDAYRRAIDLFFDFIADRHTPALLPIQQRSFVLPDEIPVSALSPDDAPILLKFAQWLLSPSSSKPGDNRPYKPSTVDLRVSGVQNWLQYLDDYGLLPAHFPLSKAKRIVKDELRTQHRQFSAPQPPEHIEEVIYYYDTQELPNHLRKTTADEDRVRRWELTRFRNRALLHALAETGGRVSELLSLNLDDFPVRYLERNEVLRVEVLGKGGHSYYLRFYDSLPAIRAYIQARGAQLKASRAGHVPLFVSHDPRYDGNRMSRVVAWRVVQRAARALGVKAVTPHDFRHWRATQLINAGHALDVVQEYLGHRSVETTRAYYAHTDPLRVDDAAKTTGLPEPEDLIED